MARRRFTTFSIAFIDCMCCGFGATILVLMIISATMSKHAEAELRELSEEAALLGLDLESRERGRQSAQAKLANSQEELGDISSQIEEIEEAIRASESMLVESKTGSAATKLAIEQMRSKLEAQRTSKNPLGEVPDLIGDSVREVRGEGRRQYLTGLRMSGKRSLILVDASASMLDETLVNVIRRRNMSHSAQVQSAKWQRAVATVDWLTAQLAPGNKFQIFSFDADARPVIEDTEGEWLEVTDGKLLTRAVERLKKTAPSGATNLHAALAVAGTLSPRPDNVFLLVDGLPTRGKGKPKKRSVTGEQRLQHFSRAVRALPRSVPVNVILYPMEGDPQAAGAYWWLALKTRGSFMTPSSDWP